MSATYNHYSIYPVKMRYSLRPETVDKLKSLPAKFGFNGLGETVAKRTYMRGAETWADVVIRVVEGTMSIRKDHYIKNSLSWNDEKNHALADNLAFGMFDMKWLPPGRGLWMMGTDYAYERGSAALNNCGAINTEDDLVFAAEWSMDMLMNGVGIGFSTGWRGEVKPAVKDDFELYVIPDSREGWVESVIKLMCSYINSPKYGTCKFPKFDYSQIRSAGTPIAGFGGVASGSEPLQKLHTRIESYLDTFCNGYIEVITNGETTRKHYDHTRLIADIFNAIGACVVAGNVRRCIAKGSLVHTNTGPIPIENIKIGDELEGMHACIWHTVTATFDQGLQKVIKITTSHNTFVCTPNHKVAVVIPLTNPIQYDWKYAGELVVGQDQLVSSVFNPDTIFEAETKGRLSMMPRLPVNILSITNETEKIQTYDIEVDDSHMFFCDGHLVHNSAEISTGDVHDDTFLNLKNINMNPERADISWMSNNSVKLKAALDYDDYSYLPMIAKRIYENGEPGIINLTNMQKYGRFGKEMEDEADMFNPCVTDDTWVATSVGLQQVHDLVGVPFNALVDNKQYECRNGFFLTGRKPVFTLATREGFVLRATSDHQIMTPCGAWVKLGSFGVGDKIRLVNNESSKITLLNNEATVKSITFSGFEGVYDATIEDIHAFSANGIYVHNCGEICLEGGNKKKETKAPADKGEFTTPAHNAVGGELCVGANTRILTREGWPKISSVVGKTVDIWNGQKWSPVTPFQTGTDKFLYRVTLSDGSYLDSTSEHRWSAKRRTQTKFREIPTCELESTMHVEMFELSPVQEGICLKNAYLWGFFMGTGIIIDNKVIVPSCKSRVESAINELDKTSGEVNAIQDLEIATQMKDPFFGIPDMFFELDFESTSLFVGGIVDSVGSLKTQNGWHSYHINLPSKPKLLDLQLILRRIGINHSTISNKTVKCEIGQESEIWRLSIPSYEASNISNHCWGKKGTKFIERAKAVGRTKKQRVISIEKLEGKHDTFCFTENEVHKGVFNNVLTHQCNLSEVFPNRCNGIEEFFEAIKHACFYASTVSLLPTHRPESNSVIARNRRIGVSISGIAQVISNALPSGWPTMNYTLLTKVLREGYKILRTYNTWLAKEAGVPPSIRVSTIKPSGSISLLAGATPGMHFPVSRFAIRRVRIGMNSPLTPTLIASKVPYEKDFFSDNTYVFEFTIDHGPVRSAEVVSPWEQFALLAMLQRCWSDNAVSCTIYFDKTNKFLPLVNESREQLKRLQDENLLDDWVLKEFTKKIEDLEAKATTVANETIADIEKLLAMFVPVLKSVSMLPHSNHTYKQAPYEPIDEEEYKRRVAEMGIVDLSTIGGMIPIGSKFCTNEVCEL